MKLSIYCWSILFILIASTHAHGQPALKVPFEVSDSGHIFLRVRVNGSEPLLFGLDSGFEQSAISTKQAEALNLKLYGETEVTGGGENTDKIYFAKDVSLDLSGLTFTLKEVGVLALDFPSSQPNEPISGILGYDFLRRFVVQIHFHNKLISLYKPRTYRYRGKGGVLPIKMLDNYPSVAATLSFPGIAPVTTMLVIDTGAGNDVFLNSPVVRRHKLLDSKQETTEAKTLGIGGTSRIRIGRATSIRLGRIVIPDPSVHFSLATKGDSASTLFGGHIGNGILRRFKLVIIDAARSRLILEQ